MFKRSPVTIAIAAALAMPAAQAEIEVSGFLKNETAFFANGDQVTGQARTTYDNTEHDTGDVMKFENTAKLFFNGDLGENATWHGELNLVVESEELVDGQKGHTSYHQNDYFRELYVDTTGFGWDFRVGKQQQVWGTADGIKLLDIINPTDFSELNQNTMEDSRIPIFMAAAERYFDNGGSLQLIVAEREENKIPGITSDANRGHPFIMKGVDTITGGVNGFFNIAPNLSNVAATFNAAASSGAFADFGAPANGLTEFAGFTVDGFASQGWTLNPGPPPSLNVGGPISGAILLNTFAQRGFTDFIGMTDPNGNFDQTNLLRTTGQTTAPLQNNVIWNPGKKTSKSTFDHMANATFGTFNTFTSFRDPTNPALGFTGTTTQWKKDSPDDTEANAGFRYRNTLDNGLNFSLNYFYHWSQNPDINLSWHDPTTGRKLTVQRAPTTAPGPAGGGVADTSQYYTREQARQALSLGQTTSILVHSGAPMDPTRVYYGAYDPSAAAGGVTTLGAGAPTLRFTESYHRIHSIGASFDYAIDTDFAPIIVRGEFLYDKDDKQPVVDKYLLSIGDLTNGLKMEDADYFKYVIGVDITVMTNLLISGQFIQFRNLDYVDKDASCNTGFNTVDCSRYTGDFATMHITNGLNQAEENKEFYSLFLSKPIGEEQLGRWNNIIIYEENGGWWDRLDADYSINDNWVVTGEINLYWGDEDTTFGQFEDSSNVQVGMKWIID